MLASANKKSSGRIKPFPTCLEWSDESVGIDQFDSMFVDLSVRENTPAKLAYLAGAFVGASSTIKLDI